MDWSVGQLYVAFFRPGVAEASIMSTQDMLVVLDAPSTDTATADMLRDIAYDVMLEYGPVVELHLLTDQEFERLQTVGNPFIQNVLTDGQSYA